MALAAFLILLVIHVLPWIFQRRTSIPNSPAKLTMCLSAMQFLPQYFILFLLPERSFLAGASSYKFEDLLTSFALLYSICLLLFFGGLRVGGTAVRMITPAYRQAYQIVNSGAIIAFLLLVYIACMYQIFASAGGLAFFLANIGARASLLAGTGMYFILTSPASYMIVFIAIFSHFQTGRPNYFIVMGLILLVTVIEALLGGRRQPVQLLLFAALVFSLLSAEKRMFTVQNAVMVTIAMAMFVTLLVVRVNSYQEIDFLDTVLNFSHIDIYLFIIDHFRDHPYWNGHSFVDLLIRFVPGAQSSAPPPIDDGVYVYNLFMGNSVFPPTPTEDMIWNSWPPGTFGNGYMNFGPVGALLFFFIRGMIVGGAFDLCRKFNYAPVLLLIYLWVAFGFQISNLKIAQFIMLMVGLAALLPIVAFLNRVSFRVRRPGTRQ